MEYETPQFYRVIQYAQAADRDVVDMVSGEPDWDPPPALRKGLRAYADAPASEFEYPPSEGLADLREEIAQRRGVNLERVLVTNGAGEANHLATVGGLEAFSGSELLLADPVYPYYAGRAALLDADVTYVPVDEDGHLDPATVREYASEETAVVVINSPNNPMGVTYDRDTVAGVAAVAADCDALLVSDEVYDHFDYSGRFASALATDEPGCVVTNSFSKSLSITGWRVGYAIFPPSDAPAPAGGLVDRARTRHMLTNITTSRPAQTAIVHALRNTGPDYYEATRERVGNRIKAFTASLDDAGATYTEPDGAFYCMARFPGLDGTMANVERLIDEAGVAGMPGEVFGEERADWFRFSLTTDRVETAGERLRAFFR